MTETQRKRKKKPRILVVDDEEQNLTIFRGTFRREFTVLTASSAQDAIDLLEKDEPVPVIVTDQRMPQMTGVDLLAVVRERWPDTIRMVLTAYTDVDDIIDAINRGNVYKFIYKPWEKEDLLQTILNALETYELRRKNEALTDELLKQERLATVGRLVSGLTHEIGNQLTATTLSSLLLKKYAEDEFLSEKLAIIRNSFMMIHGMVREIRDFTRAQNRDLELTEGMLSATVRETLSLLTYDRDVARCQIETDLDDELGAMVHKDKIQQVLINLIKNAAQAIPSDRQGNIRVELHRVGTSATLRIRDNGDGISEENREKIWEPFFTTKQDSGTGLGLDICKQIVQAHGGTIGCESESGTGTTFEIAVPATVDEHDDDES